MKHLLSELLRFKKTPNQTSTAKVNNNSIIYQILIVLRHHHSTFSSSLVADPLSYCTDEIFLFYCIET